MRNEIRGKREKNTLYRTLWAVIKTLVLTLSETEAIGKTVVQCSDMIWFIFIKNCLLKVFMTLKRYLQWMQLLQYNPGFTRGAIIILEFSPIQ